MKEFLANFGDATKGAMVIAIVTIMVVGLIKSIPAIKNIKSKGVKKAIYQVTSLVLSSGFAVLYYLYIQKGTWGEGMWTFVVTAAAEVNVIYPLYENLGIRALFKALVKILIPSKADKVNKVVDALPTQEEVVRPTSEEVAHKQEEAEKTGWLR